MDQPAGCVTVTHTHVLLVRVTRHLCLQLTVLRIPAKDVQFSVAEDNRKNVTERLRINMYLSETISLILNNFHRFHL
jgi:hypothetical protein